MDWLSFLIGLFLGANGGVIVAGLLASSKLGDSEPSGNYANDTEEILINKKPRKTIHSSEDIHLV